MSVSEAAERGDVEQIRALLEDGGDPNEPETEEHWPPLHQAVYHDHVDAARLLLDAGADMYAPTNGGETPLLIAAQTGSARTFHLLLERGYQINMERDNAAWMLVQAATHGSIEIVRSLLALGVEVNATDFRGCTALTSAAHRDHLEVVTELLRAGADPNHRDNDTETVLMWAADHAGNAPMLRALIEAGADVNAKNDVGQTALSWVMRHGDVEMVQALFEAGTDIAPEILVRATFNGFTPIIRLLLERGVDFTLPDVHGQTALAVAKIRGHREIANLLKQAEADRQLKATGENYPPPCFPVGTPVRTLTGTPRVGWVVRVEWHYLHGEYMYTIEVEGKTQPRKTVSNRYWAEELEGIEDEHKDDE